MHAGDLFDFVCLTLNKYSGHLTIYHVVLVRVVFT